VGIYEYYSADKHCFRSPVGGMVAYHPCNVRADKPRFLESYRGNVVNHAESPR